MKLRNSTSKIFGSESNYPGKGVSDSGTSGSKRRLWKMKSSGKIRKIREWLCKLHQKNHK